MHSTCCSSSTHQDDCLLKVWYCTSKWKFGVSGLFTPPESSAGVQEGLTFSFIYLAHPRSVTGFSWRKTSKYMPRYGTTLTPLLNLTETKILIFVKSTRWSSVVEKKYQPAFAQYKLKLIMQHSPFDIYCLAFMCRHLFRFSDVVNL